MASTDMQTFIESRQKGLTSAFNAHSPDSLIQFYANDIDFSDYAWGALNMNQTALTEFFHFMYQLSKDLAFTTHAISGNENFTAWEWTIDFEMAMDDEAHGLKQGEKVAWKGVSLQKWREVSAGTWKIYHCGDYGIRQK